jgi:hypothetical protein
MDLLVVVAAAQILSSSNHDLATPGAQLNLLATTAYLLLEVMEASVRPGDVVTIELKSTGIRRCTEFQVGNWRQVEANISRGRT